MAVEKNTTSRTSNPSILSKTQESNFAKLSCLAFLAHAFKTLFMLIVIFAILVVVVALASPGVLASQWFLPLVGISCVALVFLDVLYSWFYISSFIFSLDEQYIFVRKGVIAHNYTIIPYENVQDIHVVQSVTDRIFGVWSVIIFTATATAVGSDNILGLKKEDAEVFKEAVFAKIKEAKHVTD